MNLGANIYVMLTRAQKVRSYYSTYATIVCTLVVRVSCAIFVPFDIKYCEIIASPRAGKIEQVQLGKITLQSDMVYSKGIGNEG